MILPAGTVPARSGDLGGSVPKSVVYFVSDAHLGVPMAGHERREEELLRFLSSIADTAEHLVILGDLFDFWIEYPGLVRAEHFGALHALRTIADGGTRIHYMAGNHDFALGPFLTREIGIQVHPDHADIELQGKRVHLFHGDGLLKADVGYRILRRILRNPVNQFLYKLLHPSLGIALASRCSRASRKHFRFTVTETDLNEYRAAAYPYFDAGSDIVVFGHTHYGEILTGNGKTYCNTGEWIRRYNYATLDGGEMSLWRYLPDRPAERIQPGLLKWGASES
jgi:UDP-2,3-diacylglucosamine hydrolase